MASDKERQHLKEEVQAMEAQFAEMDQRMEELRCAQEEHAAEQSKTVQKYQIIESGWVVFCCAYPGGGYLCDYERTPEGFARSVGLTDDIANAQWFGTQQEAEEMAAWNVGRKGVAYRAAKIDGVIDHIRYSNKTDRAQGKLPPHAYQMAWKQLRAEQMQAQDPAL